MLWRLAGLAAGAIWTGTIGIDVVLGLEGDQPLPTRVHAILLTSTLILVMLACTGRIAEYANRPTNQTELDAAYRRGLELGRDDVAATTTLSRRRIDH